MVVQSAYYLSIMGFVRLWWGAQALSSRQADRNVPTMVLRRIVLNFEMFAPRFAMWRERGTGFERGGPGRGRVCRVSLSLSAQVCIKCVEQTNTQLNFILDTIPSARPSPNAWL